MPDGASALDEAFMAEVPGDGSGIGNTVLWAALREAGHTLSQDDYNTLRDDLVRRGKLAKGGGPGGSVRLATDLDRERLARVKLSDPDLKRLWSLSAGICNHPECNQELLVDPTEFDEAVVMGEQAHIAPHSDEGGPRRMSVVPLGERDSYDNIILLCPNHHRGPVDGQPNTYTEDLLHKWKDDHEAWVRDTLRQAIPRIQFDDLQAVAERLASEEPVESTPLLDVDVAAKMRTNGLTSATRMCMVMAVAGAKEAQRYINYAEPTKPIGKRLRSAFMAKYHLGIQNGIEGDSLFWILWHFAAGPNIHDPKAMAPGIAILGYLFTTCEVFDAP